MLDSIVGDFPPQRTIRPLLLPRAPKSTLWARPDSPNGAHPRQPQATRAGPVHTGTSGQRPKTATGALPRRESGAQKFLLCADLSPGTPPPPSVPQALWMAAEADQEHSPPLKQLPAIPGCTSPGGGAIRLSAALLPGRLSCQPVLWWQSGQASRCSGPDLPDTLLLSLLTSSGGQGRSLVNKDLQLVQ